MSAEQTSNRLSRFDVEVDGKVVKLTPRQFEEFRRFASSGDFWVWRNSVAPKISSSFRKNKWAYYGGGALDCLYLTELGEKIAKACEAKANE